MNTAVEMIDKLRDTTQSHDRCSVVEVMGRRAGYLALNVGIAVGATSIIVPEIPYDFERDIVKRMEATFSTGKKHFIVCRGFRYRRSSANEKALRFRSV